jgi:hypothetical protein
MLFQMAVVLATGYLVRAALSRRRRRRIVTWRGMDLI